MNFVQSTAGQSMCLHMTKCKKNLAQCKILELSSVGIPIKTYKDLISNIICNNPTAKFYFGECEKRSGSDKLKSHFKDCFGKNYTDNVTHWKCLQVDNRKSLETMSIGQLIHKFLDYLFESLPKLMRHSYIAEQSSAYLKYLKENLLP